MRNYETVLIARQDISTGQFEALVEEMGKVLEEGGGKVARTELWGLKTLAYRIKKNRKGHYAMLSSEAPHAAIAELERRLRLHEDVLRFLTIKVDELEEGPSVMASNRGGRRGRDEEGDDRRDDRRGGRERGDRDRFDRGDRDRGDRDRGDRSERSYA